jgi:hypothetical protein
MDIQEWSVVGCYRIELGQWETMPNVARPLSNDPPTHIVLAPEISTFEKTCARQKPGFPVYAAKGAGAGKWMYEIGVWSVLKCRTLHIVWSSGYEVVQIDVELRAGELSGIAAYGSDAGITQNRKVKLVRIEC